MYNRYIPQPDGTYRRSRVQDQVRPSTPPTDPAPSEKESYTPEPQPCTEKPECVPEPSRRNTQCRSSCRMQPRVDKCKPPERKKEPCDTSVGGFLKNLLPKDFDTGDLLIVLLLLLMSGDCAEDQNSALLTLALYLFM